MMRRFFAPPAQFGGQTIVLSREETRHMKQVLRLKAGEQVEVFDGEGREFLCEIADIVKSGAELRVIEEKEPSAPESSLELTLAVSIYKSDKLDLVVQKAVELGVTKLSLLVTSRGEVRLRDAGNRTDRFRKIALEATKQCERAKVMDVGEPVELEEYLLSSGHSGTLLIFSEKGGEAIPTIPTMGVEKKITALIGPKGGWEDSEIELAAARGFVPVKLGRRIMRAETAAITFAALLQHRFGDLN